jgi:hypothetical protein
LRSLKNISNECFWRNEAIFDGALMTLTYIGLRIDDRKAGQELMRRALGAVKSAADAVSRTGDPWTSISVTYQSLKALGVPQEALDSLDPVFKQGMAARAPPMKDIGPSAPFSFDECFANFPARNKTHLTEFCLRYLIPASLQDRQPSFGRALRGTSSKM